MRSNRREPAGDVGQGRKSTRQAIDCQSEGAFSECHEAAEDRGVR